MNSILESGHGWPKVNVKGVASQLTLPVGQSSGRDRDKVGARW